MKIEGLTHPDYGDKTASLEARWSGKMVMFTLVVPGETHLINLYPDEARVLADKMAGPQVGYSKTADVNLDGRYTRFFIVHTSPMFGRQGLVRVFWLERYGGRNKTSMYVTPLEAKRLAYYIRNALRDVKD